MTGAIEPADATGTLPQSLRRDFSSVGHDEAMRRAREIVPILRERAQASEEGRRLYQCFEENSPLSTKEVKAAAELRGKENERAFERGMKELWSRMLVVGFGEKDDGAFPSLQVGASKLLLEPMWRRGREMSEGEAREIVERVMPEGSMLSKDYGPVTT